MYQGFNVSVRDDWFKGYRDDGLKNHTIQKARIGSAIDSFTGDDGSLIASKVAANWFPSIDADVFISHSHQDSELAIQLAGFLEYEFSITPFIDSCAWGYSNDLLKLLDDEYCYQKESDTYSYSRRNRSTCHVFMMLSVALSKMMNDCECVMFLNTPSSISSKAFIQGKTTDSPWIYSEIAMTGLLQRRSLPEHRRMAKSLVVRADEALDEELQVTYEVELGHLTKLGERGIASWKSAAQAANAKGADALDILYNLKRFD